MPLYSFSCAAHGAFDKLLSLKAPMPRCPKGCSDKLVTKLVSAANIGSTNGTTKFIDRKTADLARQFGDTAMNDKYDSSRIDMSVNDSIQKKRLAGQTYSVALDPKTGVSGYLGGTVSPEISASERAKESASQAVRQTVIVKDDHATLPASAP